MCLSLRFEEKFDEDKGAKNDDGISINRGKLRKNFRLGFKVHTKLLPSQHLHNKKEQQSARSRVFACVCVCV